MEQLESSRPPANNLLYTECWIEDVLRLIVFQQHPSIMIPKLLSLSLRTQGQSDLGNCWGYLLQNGLCIYRAHLSGEGSNVDALLNELVLTWTYPLTLMPLNLFAKCSVFHFSCTFSFFIWVILFFTVFSTLPFLLLKLVVYLVVAPNDGHQ